jgi:hypothetical protein
MVCQGTPYVRTVRAYWRVERPSAAAPTLPSPGVPGEGKTR